MFAKDLITEQVPTLSPDDTGQTALNWMDMFKISHLPVVKDSEYMGLISDKYIYDNNLPDTPLEGHLSRLDTLCVTGNQHIYETASAMFQSGTTVLPVATQEKTYEGALTINAVFRGLAGMLSLNESGGIVVLRVPEYSYSLSQIGRIVEENDVRILSLNIFKPVDSNMLNITMKLNKIELLPILRSFERLGYQIAVAILDNSVVHDLYENRFEHFLRYMNY